MERKTEKERADRGRTLRRYVVHFRGRNEVAAPSEECAIEVTCDALGAAPDFDITDVEEVRSP